MRRCGNGETYGKEDGGHNYIGHTLEDGRLHIDKTGLATKKKTETIAEFGASGSGGSFENQRASINDRLDGTRP